MPQPVPSAVHVDAALTNISVAYIQSADNFIADKVFPVVPVAKQSDLYRIYEKGAFFRDEARRRAPATESAGSGFTMTTAQYMCEKWAIHKDVDDDTVANADAGVDCYRDAAVWTTQQLLIRRERMFAANFMATGKWGTDVVGATNFNRWDDEASSDPAEDVKDGRIAILSKTGMLPNTLVVGYEVHEALKKHPLIAEKFKYTSSASITTAMIANYLEVEKYVVAKGIYTTSEEGVADASLSFSFIHGKNALLCYSAPTPSLLTSTAGYNFVWSGLTGINNMGFRTKRFRMENLEAERVEAEFAMCQKLIAADMGYFFSGAVA